MYKVWEIIYPVGIYFVVSNIAMVILNMLWTQTDRNYLVQHMIATIVSFPFVYSFYEKSVKERQTTDWSSIAGMAIMAGAAGIVLNNIIAITPLIEQSTAFQEVNNAFYGSSLLVEIVATCVLTPILEETLYRGVVYQKLRDWVGVKRAVVISAVIFGAMHFNMVQFIYSTILGILLAIFMERVGIKGAVIAHMVINLISVLRSETGFLDFMEQSKEMYAIGTIGAVVIMIGCIIFITHNRNRTNEL